MTGRIEFTNVNREEQVLTQEFLHAHGAYAIKVDSDSEGNPHFEFSIAVDTPEDIQNFLAVMLFYNNLSPELAHKRAIHFVRELNW